MLLGYTAGLYSDSRGVWYVRKNIRQAEEVASRLWEWSYSIICPHLNTYLMDGLCKYEDWLTGDFEQIRRCDFIVMLPRYVTSSGAQRELDYALKHGIEPFFWEIEKDREALRTHSHGLKERF